MNDNHTRPRRDYDAIRDDVAAKYRELQSVVKVARIFSMNAAKVSEICREAGINIGDGYGYGSGYGDGITEFNGQKVWMIDRVATIIDSVSGNFAKGSILNNDFTLIPCYIAKVDNCFAHGDTLRHAFNDAQSKAFEKKPLSERIAKFKEQFPDPDTKIPARQLYDWHHILTGSCEIGRNQFAKEHGINIDADSFTVREFIRLTCHSYGYDAIKNLANAYGIKQ